MMTKRERTAAVKEIRARAAERREDVLDPKPVTAKWVPCPPFKALANPHSDRGHGPGKTCKRCRKDRPKGGWPTACGRGDAREFTGG